MKQILLLKLNAMIMNQNGRYINSKRVGTHGSSLQKKTYQGVFVFYFASHEY